MSRVSITELFPGDIATAANANATLTSWDSASAAINGANLRNEGLAKRNFDPSFQVFGDTTKRDYTDGLHDTLAGIVALGELTPKIQCGGFDLEAGDELIVRAGFQFVGDTTKTTITGQVGYKSGSAGAIAGLTQTKRKFTTMDVVSNIRHISNYCVCHRFTEVSVASDLWFSLMIGTSAALANVEIRHPYIMAIRLRA